MRACVGVSTVSLKKEVPQWRHVEWEFANKRRQGSKERSMEHRWGHRLSTNIPVRLRCMQSRDSGCRCLGCLESVSARGALIRTELGICPAPNVVVATLAPALGLQG